MMECRLHGASHEIAIDLADSRLDAAKGFGADVTVNNAVQDPMDMVAELTDGLGADVAIEAVGVPATFELATRLVRPTGRVAVVGVFGEPASLHLEDLWIRNVTIRTGLVDGSSTPNLLRLPATGQSDAGSFVTHRFPVEDLMEAYDVFSRPNDTGPPRPS